MWKNVDIAGFEAIRRQKRICRRSPGILTLSGVDDKISNQDSAGNSIKNNQYDRWKIGFGPTHAFLDYFSVTQNPMRMAGIFEPGWSVA